MDDDDRNRAIAPNGRGTIEGRAMRVWISIIVSIFLVQAAQAADVLRGSSPYVPGAPTYFNWSGVYFGAQAGYGSARVNPEGTTQDLIARMLRQTTIEDEANVSTWPQIATFGTGSAQFGGFVGYNSQWGDVILGLELNYVRGNFNGQGADSLGRSYQTSDDYFYDVFVSGSTKVKIMDYATFRARAGYAMDYFLPYAFGGLAVGRANVSRSAFVNLSATDVSGNDPQRPDLSYTDSLSETRNGVIAYGVTAGLGLDVALTQNLFVRAEWEYIYFSNFQGVTAQINALRAGVGAKF
jgi:outer membrane immunogenic protein